MFLRFFFFVLLTVVSVHSVEELAIEKSPEFVYELVLLSDKAYDPLAELQMNRSLSLFYERGKENQEAAFCGFVTKLGNAAVVAFHGTRDGLFLKHDALIDADVVMGGDGGYKNEVAPFENFAVHKGFAREVESCYDAICRIIDNKNFGNFDELIFTGHSMGAAMAQLAALLYCKKHCIACHRDENKVKVFAFSSPAIFNKEAREFYHRILNWKNSIHIYVNTDVVASPHKFYLAGVQANLSFFNRPGAVFPLFGFLGSLCSKTKEVFGSALETAKSVHTIKSFTFEDIKEIMLRIQANYMVNPDMGCENLGRL